MWHTKDYHIFSSLFVTQALVMWTMGYFYDYFIVLFVTFGSSQALGSLLLLNGKDQCELGLSSDYNFLSN